MYPDILLSLLDNEVVIVSSWVKIRRLFPWENIKINFIKLHSVFCLPRWNGKKTLNTSYFSKSKYFTVVINHYFMLYFSSSVIIFCRTKFYYLNLYYFIKTSNLYIYFNNLMQKQKQMSFQNVMWNPFKGLECLT